MTSDEADFWDRRYRTEGAIWGHGPSPTAVLGADHAGEGARALDVGFGYGRDLPYLIRRRCRVSGVEISHEGHCLAVHRLRREGLRAECLLMGRFEDVPLPEGLFDVVLSHRLAHLLLSREEVTRFADRVGRVLRPGGVLCLGARSTRDLEPGRMVRVEGGVYEYRNRPGHRIRYWDDAAFREAFGPGFEVLSLTEAVEPESAARPVPCHCTVMVARKKVGAPDAGRSEP